MRRFLTAALLIPLVIALVLWGPPTLLGSVVVALTAVALWEYFRLAEAAGMKALPVPGYAFGLAVVLLILTDSPPVVILAAAVFFLMLLWVAAMSPSRQLAACLGSVSATFLGVVYVAVPLGLLAWICLRRDGPGSFLILFMLAVIWAGDAAGYYVGSAWGRHKSSPRISPGKSWEGTAGSLAAALLIGFLFARFLWGDEKYGEPLLLAAALNGAGQLGDLAESALKRAAGVKDSSQLVPGHGGVLDRIDALLFTVPVLWYYWLWKAF
ncbi:MAG: phosphatidate cytidylyltransferase [Acidobacteria bacterium]|nr:phosphatidate cytidylyltransferase [Acidobacteriota bacterium]MCZ6490687.1 phosphatidate cytidylyltransferase [Acidobacteriota bacterium]MCZ6751285.1 phosphatidate cytidylyltransferase [Acidobacteriota bacterium]